MIERSAIIETADIRADARLGVHPGHGRRLDRRRLQHRHALLHRVRRGDRRRVTVKNGNFVWAGVTLEAGVFVGPGVVFTNDRWPRSPRSGYAGDRYDDAERGWCRPWLDEVGRLVPAPSCWPAFQSVPSPSSRRSGRDP